MRERPYFPLFVDLGRMDILFVGGGAIAVRRIRSMLPFVERVSVVTKQISPGLAALMEEAGAASGAPGVARQQGAGNAGAAPQIIVEERSFVPADLEGRDLVLAATDDETLNQHIAGLCRKRRIPVNISSDKTQCDFYFPGIVRQGETVIGITASGQDHRKAKKVRERIVEILLEEC